MKSIKFTKKSINDFTAKEVNAHIEAGAAFHKTITSKCGGYFVVVEVNDGSISMIADITLYDHNNDACATLLDFDCFQAASVADLKEFLILCASVWATPVSDRHWSKRTSEAKENKDIREEAKHPAKAQLEQPTKEKKPMKKIILAVTLAAIASTGCASTGQGEKEFYNPSSKWKVLQSVDKDLLAYSPTSFYTSPKTGVKIKAYLNSQMDIYVTFADGGVFSDAACKGYEIDVVKTGVKEQKIKFNIQCDKEQKTLIYSPHTKKARLYLVESFIEYDEVQIDTLKFSGKGFTEAAEEQLSIL